MRHLNINYIIGSLAGGAFVLFLLAIAVGTAQGDNSNDYRIAEFRKQIFDAQVNAEDAHISLEKAKEVVRVAVEAERKAEAIVNGYSETANAARKAICALSKEACINENLDPAGAGTNLQEFFTQAR